MKSFLIIFIISQFSHIFCYKLDEEYFAKYLYEELKCVPKNDGKYYDCSNITNNEKCIFEGKSYEIGEKLENEQLVPYCRSNCTCGKNGIFDCAKEECKESNYDCYGVYTLDKCCPIEERCELPEIDCRLNWLRYREGDIFDTDGVCKRCLCSEGFNNITLDEPHCVPKKCFEQIFNMEKIRNKCAASFFSAQPCCPTAWICNTNQHITRRTNRGNSRLFCEFGTKKIPHGYGFDAVDPQNTEVRCECTFPPFITCLERYRVQISSTNY